MRLSRIPELLSVADFSWKIIYSPSGKVRHANKNPEQTKTLSQTRLFIEIILKFMRDNAKYD